MAVRGRRFNRSTPLGKLLHERDLTVRELCEGTGIHSRTISDYLSGRVAIREHHLVEICDALDVDPAVLLD